MGDATENMDVVELAVVHGWDDWVEDPSLTLKGLNYIFPGRPLRQLIKAARTRAAPNLIANVFATLDGRRKSRTTLEWFNLALLAIAHKALTGDGVSREKAAAELLHHLPKNTALLRAKNKSEKNRPGLPFTDKDRIIQLRKQFDAGRATKNQIAISAYKAGCKTIRDHKGDHDALARLAADAMLGIKALSNLAKGP